MKKLCTHFIPIFIILCITLFVNILPSDNLQFFQNPINELSENWEINLPNKSVDISSLPAIYPINPNETIVISKILENNFPDFQSLRIRSSMQYINVYIDDQLIFESDTLSQSLLHTPEASTWHIIQLPNDIGGKKIYLSISSRVKAFSGVINPIFYGKSSDLMAELISRHLFIIISSIIILFLGLLMLIISLTVKLNGNKRLNYLSLFMIFTSIWLLSELDILQFFTGNRFIIGGISYLFMPLASLYFILYMTEIVLSKYKKPLTALASIFLILFLVNLILQITGLVFFIDSLITVISMVILTSITTISLLIYKYIHYKDKISLKYIRYLSFFLATVIIEGIMFITDNFNTISSLSSLGLIVFIALLIIDNVKYYNSLISQKSEAILLEKLAYMDILTKGLNRTAFMRDIENIMDSKTQPNFRLITADLNDLKIINDQYGHIEGDKAIINSHECLAKSIGSEGICYRMGGDEFACIVYNPDYNIYLRILFEIKQCINDFNCNNSYNLDIAIGTGIYSPKFDESFDEFMHRVDLEMYKDKRLKKVLHN